MNINNLSGFLKGFNKINVACSSSISLDKGRSGVVQKLVFFLSEIRHVLYSLTLVHWLSFNTF